MKSGVTKSELCSTLCNQSIKWRENQSIHETVICGDDTMFILRSRDEWHTTHRGFLKHPITH